MESKVYSDVIYKAEMISLEPEEEKKIFGMLEEVKRDFMWGDKKGTIIRKNYLDIYGCLVIELKEPKIMMSLVDVRVDREENTLSGTRIFVNASRGYLYKRYTFSLDDYRKKWRAWNGVAPKGRPWRGRTYG